MADNLRGLSLIYGSTFNACGMDTMTELLDPTAVWGERHRESPAGQRSIGDCTIYKAKTTCGRPDGERTRAVNDA